ncbi:major facilitator superfamily domain-containing protein [Aspergillus alliaceus]|uniref:Major facilitator superfamily domain-containing protein n=1 Tax=Petromyces alliaceus TaxID=209559 RepID=A0A5N7BU65_PETAA|nr:major facilitator superfamily domain-containing protein [Aspergillus alliaceus]
MKNLAILIRAGCRFVSRALTDFIHKSQGQVPHVLVTFQRDDPDNPQNFHPLFKIWLVIQMSLLAMVGALGSSITSSAQNAIAKYVNISTEVAPLTVALFVLGWAFGPIIWAPISELYGRRIGMLPALLILGLFSIGTATSQDAQSIFLTRFFGGIFASAPISNIPAALGDIYGPEARGIAMAFVSICITGGPTLGPIISAAVVIKPDLGWRWAEYIEEIAALSLSVICFLCLPETYAPVLLKRKAQKLRKETGDSMLFTEPQVTFVALYASFTYALIYLTLEVFPIVFEEHRHWHLVPSTLPFLGILVGVSCAALVNFLNQPRYKRAIQKNNGKPVPKARLPPIFIGGILLTGGLFWFGWTVATRYPWPLPVVGGGLIGTGFTIVFQQCLNFLVDAYGPYAASAVSANTILRSILACALPMAARPMFENLGIAPASSLLGGISCLALPVPFLLMKYGAVLRKKSRFIPLPEF